MANYYGDMGIGNLSSGLDSIINAFQGMSQQRQIAELGDQIRTGDLLGAADTAIKRGNVDLGLKLYQLHQDNTDTGLGEKLQNILKPAAPQLTTGRSVAVPTAAADTIGAMAYAPAVAGGETSATDPNAYSTTGITIPKTGDRAYGKYQVMGANVGPWTKEVLGTEMSPQEFLANPDAQDAVFKGKFGQYVQKYGPDGAARVWIGGKGGLSHPNATDPLGTSVASYAAGFNRRLGQPPAQQAISDATGTAPDGTPITLAASRGLGPAPAPAAQPEDDNTPDTPTTGIPAGPRPLGKPPVASADDADNAQLNDLISKRNQVIGLMSDPGAKKHLPMIQQTIAALNEQIQAARKPDTDPVALSAQRAKAFAATGGDPNSPEGIYYTRYGKPMPTPAEKGKLAQYNDNMEILKRRNINPDSPEGQFFLLNGKLPENFGQMKGQELKEFATKQDSVNKIKQQVDQLKQALELNDKAYSGSVSPGAAAWIHSNMPGGDMIVDPKRVVATAQFNNNVQGALMGMGKDMVGARVAVYEEQLIQKLKANPDMAPDVRKALLQDFIKHRTQAMDDAQKELDDMQSGTRFKKGGSVNPPAAKPGTKTINGYTIEPAD